VFHRKAEQWFGMSAEISAHMFSPTPVCFSVFNQLIFQPVDDDGSGCPIDNSMRR
jgi:hypothetical protein